MLQLRGPEVKSHPGLWDISAAGHAASGESGLETALRETKEELGLSLKEEDLEFVVKRVHVSKRGDYINREHNYIYLLKKDIDLTDLNLGRDEVERVRFFPLSELEEKVLSDDPSLVPHKQEYKILFDALSK